MNILIPNIIENFTSNIPENDYVIWSNTSSYSLSSRVIVPTEHNIYESLIANNVGNIPSSNPATWVLVGKTNAYKLIDDKVSTQTISTTPIIMSFPLGKSTCISFLNIKCESIKIEILVSTTVIYTIEQQGYIRNTTGWYDYFTGDFEYKNSFIFKHLYNPASTYRITIIGSDVRVGVMLIGNLKFIGDTAWNPSLSFVDYSKKEVDAWGEIYLKQGAYRDVFKGELSIETNLLSNISRVLRDRRGKLSLFIPTQAYEMNLYGYMQEPTLVWQNPSKSTYTIDIQGVI